MTASCKPDRPCSGTRPAPPVLPQMQDIQKIVSHLAPRQERRTPDRTTLPAPRQPAQPAARETKARRDRKIGGAEHRDIGVSINGNRAGSPGGYVRGKQEIVEPLLAVPQTRTIRPSLTSLHNYA